MTDAAILGTASTQADPNEEVLPDWTMTRVSLFVILNWDQEFIIIIIILIIERQKNNTTYYYVVLVSIY